MVDHDEHQGNTAIDVAVAAANPKPRVTGSRLEKRHTSAHHLHYRNER